MAGQFRRRGRSLAYIDTDSADIAAGIAGVVVIERRKHLVGDDVSVDRLIASFFD